MVSTGRRTRRAGGLALLATAGVVGFGTTIAAASSLRTVIGAPPARAAGHVIGERPPASPLRLTIVLRPRDAAGLAAWAAAVATPGSPRFRHYLSVAAFAARFGAGRAQIDAVRRALEADGLRVGPPAANRLSLRVTGTTATVRQAFATAISTVRLAPGVTAFANRRAPTLPAAVAADVQAVIGLSSVPLMRPLAILRPRSRPARRPRPGILALGARSARRARPGPDVHAPRATAAVATAGPQPCPAASAAARAGTGGYTADTIASAYGFPGLYARGDLGAGQVIGLFELFPTDPTDIAAYQSCYRTSTPVLYANVDGGPGPYVLGRSDDTEPALDIEQVIGLAPRATVVDYQAPDTANGAYDALSEIVGANVAKTISISYGSCEALQAEGGNAYAKSEDFLFQEAAAQGQTAVAAAGDHGAADCLGQRTPITTASENDPGVQPFVTSVGGTLLYTAGSAGDYTEWALGAPLLEAVWNDHRLRGVGPAATGGGISSVWPMPAYQSGSTAALGVINGQSSGVPCGAAAQGFTYCREVPDVSAAADPLQGYVVYVDGRRGGDYSGWLTAGGTSASTPLWAALVALADAQPSCRGLTIGFADPALYSLAAAGRTRYLRDVSLASPVTGAADNDALGTTGGLFPVTAGYDMTTGLGAPNATNLAGGLCAIRAPVYKIAFAAVHRQVAPVGRPLSLSARASDAGRVPVVYTAAGLPAGLSVNAFTGLVSGIPRAIGTTTAVITARDNYGNAGSLTVAWRIVAVGRPRTSGAELSGIARRRPRLRFIVHRGRFAPSLKAVSISLPRGLSFVRSTRQLGRGLLVKVGHHRARHSIRLGHGVLTVTLRRPATGVYVAIGHAALRASPALVAQARRRRQRPVRVRFGARDAQRRSTRLVVELRLRR